MSDVTADIATVLPPDDAELATRYEPETHPSSLLTSLVIVARHRGILLSASQLVRDHLLEPGEPSTEKLVQVARACGLRAVATPLDWRALMNLGPAAPAIVRLVDGSAMVVLQANPNAKVPHVVLQDPAAGPDALLTLDETRFTAAWTGETILLKRDYRAQDKDQPFGWWLILNQVWRDKRTIREIAVAVVCMSLLSLTPILFIRLLVDRVMTYRAGQTLAVLSVIVLVLLLFEALFGYLRRLLTLRITRRLEANISTFMFNKVLALPVDFFERTPTGKILHDMQEFHKIRQFLTKDVFTTLLDAWVVVVILPILCFYSFVLTGFVLGFSVLICIWMLVQMPILRYHSNLTVQADVERGTFLVESVHGIRTIKSLALDALRRHEWDVRVAKAAQHRYDLHMRANVIQNVAMPLERMMTTGVLALAAYFAITSTDQVYVGALLAFWILTQRLATPLIQLTHATQEYDEVRIAMEQLRRLLNQAPEEGRSGAGIRTPLTGRIEFQNVKFSYPGTVSPALDGVTFAIPQGSVFGIMGRSGSGKTTVTRLLQMLHSEYQGLIKVDGSDLREYDVDHLRSSIGVVLQDNFLFSGTLRENIAAAKPDATLEDVVRAARLAGAEEFIERLPRGYETFINEGSTNLSGGQRQRIAIARALIGNPRILILDEATSALDAESEAIVNANLRHIAKGRTLIVISHRLSSLVSADAILVLERGAVYDQGPHKELLERCDIYSGLWHQQHRHLLPGPGHDVIPLRANAAE